MQRGNIQEPRRRKVRGIDDATAKYQEHGQRVAGNVAANRYKGINQRGAFARLGGHLTTGAQNKTPVTKKLAAWTSCHQRDRTPSSNTAGTCHPIKATAELLEHGLLRGSFVPPAPIRELRDLTRYRKTQIQERVREVNRLHKVLEDAGVKLAVVASDVLGVSGRAMLEALL